VQPLLIDRATGVAKPMGLAVPVCNAPIHLQVAGAGDRLTAACSADGGVAVLGIDRATGELTLLGFAEGSGDAVHVGVHPSGEFVLTSDYGPQSFVTLYRIDAQGRPTRLQSLELDPYMHSARFSASGEYVYAASQGSNRIWQLAFDAEGEQLVPLEPEAVTAITDEPGGSEPRHVLPSPDGKLLYATGQKPPLLLTFEIDAASGKLSKRGGGLPLFAGVVEADCCGKDLIITPEGDRIFASSWGVDRLSAFTVAANGMPQRDSVAASGGLGAQSVALDPEREFLFVMHDGEQAGLSLFRLVGGMPTFVNRVPGLVGQGVAAVVLD
jgi:6-phosphogluconolactonase (cycloisomerase 2 family)